MAVGKIEQFDLTKDSWDSYVDRLEQYFIVNDVKEAVKVATLITVIGSDAYELMVNLCIPCKPAVKTYSELVQIMKSHLQPRPSLLAERFKFRQRTQRNGESIADYVAELKRLSKDCKFAGASLTENMRDQFVCGLVSDSIRQRLFAEDDIQFDKAFKLAVAMESAEVDAALVEGRARSKADSTAAAAASVHQLRNDFKRNHSHNRTSVDGTPRGTAAAGRITDGRGFDAGTSHEWRGGGAKHISGAGSGYVRKGRSISSSNNKTKMECNICGGHHDDSVCKFKLYVCRVCNKEGHLKRMCPKLQKKSSVYNLKEVANAVEFTSGSDSDEVNNYSLNTNTLNKFVPYTVSICVNGKIIVMEIDTGSAISCISHDTYKNMFGNTVLEKCNLCLRYYTGEIVKPVGMFRPSVTFKNKCKQLELYIVESGKTNLLGRQWLEEFGILGEITQCNNNSSKIDVFNLREFSSRFSEVFDGGLGRFTGGRVGFHLREGARPVFLRARPLAYALREPVERALDQLVRDGVITPVTTSDWATPIVPVMKKDGTIRICGDFKITLNKCLEVDRFPLPKVEDLLTKLHGGEKFSKIDLSQAYAQFELDDSKKYTVINTHKGLFMYNRLIYGLSSSPGIFQRKLEQLFGDMPRVGVFLDDLIITGIDDSSHMATLREVFERLRKYGLKVKKEKCLFFCESVTYLGFVISKEGVHTCPDKIEAIRSVAIPTNVTELRSFLGLVMYYAKFVPNISTTLSPLYELLRKEVKFEWNDKCHKAFDTVKKMLTSSKVLAHYSADLPLVLTTDASSVGVGAVIAHVTPRGERPIAYASRALNAAERAYSQIDKEALAIIFGVRKFHQYLYGRKFILKTDHKPLVTIFGDKTGIPVMAASRLQRWAVILAGYNYDIEYVRSNKNVADALSRLPVETEPKVKSQLTYLNFVQQYLPVTRTAVRNETNKDNVLKKVVLFLQSGWPGHCDDPKLQQYFSRRNELYLDMGCIVWGYRLVIPGSLQKSLLEDLHVGHMGIVKMKSMARSIMWWPGIDVDIEEVVKGCNTCALENAAPPRASPQPWPYATEPWTRVHVDFLGPMNGKSFLVLIDATSKWIEIFQMFRTTASAVIRKLRETFARFGLPKEVVSDNGPPFSSKEYAEFMNNNGIKITFAAVYHPSSNGAAEGAVKLCKRAIKKSIRDNCDLDTSLQSYLMAYRNVEHSTTGASPAMLLQRRNLRSRLDLLKGDRQVEDRVRESQRKQIEHAGGKSRDFEIGDKVWARDYTGEKKWLEGQVESKIGSRNYVISRGDGPPIKRHIDQIKSKWSSTVELPAHSESPGIQGTITGSDGSIARPQIEREVVILGDHRLDSSNVEPATVSLTRSRSTRVRRPVVRYGMEFD